MTEQSSLQVDAVTGALARSGFETLLAERVAECARLLLPCSLLVFDLDHFKRINDAFGHARGDQALAEVARRVRTMTRTVDAFFRYDGDEFVLVLPGLDHDRAMQMGGRLIEVVRGTPVLPDIPLTVTLSVGVATFPDDADGDATLFERADARNYAAKRQGRDRVVGEELPRASALPFQSLSRLVDRNAELASLASFLTDLRNTSRGVLTIGGPAGAGRTALLDEAVRRGLQRGMTVLDLRCTPRLKSQPYGALALAMPALRRDIAALQSRPGAERTAEAVAALVENHLAGQLCNEVLCAVDDAVHLDWSTHQVLRELLGNAGLGVVGLILVGDPETMPYRAPLVASVSVRPLQAESVRIWMRMLLQWEPPPEFIDWLISETQGMPRRIERLVTYLHSTGLLAQSQGQWHLHTDYRGEIGQGTDR